MIRRFSLLSLLMVLTSLALAQEDETKCCCSTYETDVCLNKVRASADRTLEDTYQKALKAAERYSSKDVERLKKSQAAWIAYRNADCDAEYGLWDGGSGGPNAYGVCMIGHIKQRTTELHDRYLHEH